MATQMDTRIAAKLYQAQIKDGVPPELKKVPFRNIRDLLSLAQQDIGRQDLSDLLR